MNEKEEIKTIDTLPILESTKATIVEEVKQELKAEVKQEVTQQVKQEAKEGFIDGLRVDVKKRWYKSKIFIFNLVSLIITIIMLIGPDVLNTLMLNNYFVDFFKEKHQTLYMSLIILNTTVNMYLRLKNQDKIVFRKRNETDENGDQK